VIHFTPSTTNSSLIIRPYAYRISRMDVAPHLPLSALQIDAIDARRDFADHAREEIAVVVAESAIIAYGGRAVET